MDLPISIKPISRAKTRTLKRLDYLIGTLSDRHPENLQEYIQGLTHRYTTLNSVNHLEEAGLDLTPLIDDSGQLKEYPALSTSYLNYYLNLLDIEPEAILHDNEVTVSNRNYLKSFLFPDYYNLLTLTDVYGRDETVGIWKRYITEYIIDNRTPREPMEDVQEYFESRNRGNTESEWVIVHGVIADGKYAYKNENCTWVDAMEELPDPELKYLVCCYGDYEGARSRGNHLVFTMEHTIAEGDPYCSRVIHDTRVNWVLDHPPKKFWDDFNP